MRLRGQLAKQGSFCCENNNLREAVGLNFLRFGLLSDIHDSGRDTFSFIKTFAGGSVMRVGKILAFSVLGLTHIRSRRSSTGIFWSRDDHTMRCRWGMNNNTSDSVG